MKLSYTGKLSEAQRRAISTYVTIADRGDPLVFRGREETLQKIRNQVEYPAGEAGGSLTHLITGVPGVGKSALLSEIAKRERDTANVAIIDGLNLREKRGFINVCAKVLGVEVDHEDLENATKKTLKGAELYAHYKHESTLEKTPSIETELGHWEILAKLLKKSTQPLILCIDEIQNTPDTPFARSVINQLHISQTDELSVIPVFSGLLNSLEVLAERGVSRVGENRLQLRALSRADSRAIVQQTLSHADFGLNGANGFSVSDLSMLGELLSQTSENWPRHLNSYIKGVLSCILKDQSKSSPTQKIDLSQALEIGHESRVDYYESMFDAIVGIEGEELARQLASIFESEPILTRTDFQEKAASISVEFKDKSTFTSAFKECLRKGFIENVKGIRESYGIPIPSLSTYLRNGMNQYTTLQELRDQATTTLQELHDRDTSNLQGDIDL